MGHLMLPYAQQRMRAFPAGSAAAFRADSGENDIVTGNPETVAVFDFFLQTGDIVHIHIKNLTAFLTLHMIVLMPQVIKAIRPARDLNSTYHSRFRQPLQIPIYRCPADGRMPLHDCLINLIRGGVATQAVYRL